MYLQAERAPGARPSSVQLCGDPLGLLQNECFGHGGEHSGAIAQKTGRFELANKGTLFLDELGDIPLELQAKLLRVLQEQEFDRLGSNRTHKVDVRLIAATLRDLAAMVKQVAFREDLYYRLKVFPVNVLLSGNARKTFRNWYGTSPDCTREK